MNILETFKFRGHFPGISNLLMAINRLLDTGAYQVKIPLDPENPKELQISIYSNNTSHPTLALKLPLDEEISGLRMLKLADLCSRDKKSGKKEFVYFSSEDDESINFLSGSYVDSFTSYESTVVSSKIVNEHTFELRKSAPGISDVLSAISSLLNEHHYTGTATMDANTHRWLQLQLFYHNQMEATLVLARKLRTVSKADITELTKLNFAWAYHAPVEFQSLDDLTMHVVISEPSNPNKLRSLLASYSLLQ